MKRLLMTLFTGLLVSSVAQATPFMIMQELLGMGGEAVTIQDAEQPPGGPGSGPGYSGYGPGGPQNGYGPWGLSPY
jgi:hypothetical protein